MIDMLFSHLVDSAEVGKGARCPLQERDKNWP